MKEIRALKKALNFISRWRHFTVVIVAVFLVGAHFAFVTGWYTGKEFHNGEVVLAGIVGLDRLAVLIFE